DDQLVPRLRLEAPVVALARRIDRPESHAAGEEATPRRILRQRQRCRRSQIVVWLHLVHSWRHNPEIDRELAVGISSQVSDSTGENSEMVAFARQGPSVQIQSDVGPRRVWRGQAEGNKGVVSRVENRVWPSCSQFPIARIVY